MTSTLLIVQIVLAIAITISVLLQKSSSIGLGAYSGSNESMFGAKGPMGFLAKLTFTLGLLFILNTLVLGYLYTKENSKTVADTIASSIPVSPETQKAAAPAAPAAPATANTQTSEAAPTVPSTPAAAATESNSTIPKPPKTSAPETEKRSEPATH
jgi:preprotein translocase subunit SecG